MKITDVRAVYPKYRHVPASWRTQFWQVVVRVQTDTGVAGLGCGGGGVASVAIVNGHFRELLLGREVNSLEDIAAIWDHLYAESLPYGRKGLAIMALSGVDLALYDLLGKAQKMPVYDLLGGARKQAVTAYATGANTEWYASLGFRNVKFPHRWTGDERGYESARRAAETARRSVGTDGRVMIDTYMSWDAEVTRAMHARLSEYNIYWFEDVLTPDHLDAQAALRSDVQPVLISGGEHEFTQYGFQELARSEALDLWQPDITWCGGITAGLRILDIAREAGVPVAPHRGGEPWGLHLIAATDCMDFAEVHSGVFNTKRDEVWLGEPRMRDGYIAPTDAPGFGVRLNEAML